MKFWRLWTKAGNYSIAVIVICVFGILAPSVLSITNLTNILIQTSMITIAGCGMVFALTSGGFDLSIGSSLALTTCIVGICIKRADMGITESVLLALVCVAFVGFLNGLLITKLKIMTFVATLATMVFIRGLAFLITNGRDINLQEHMELKKTFMGSIAGIPTPIIIMFSIAIIFFLIYKFTRFGVYIRAIGSNEYSSRNTGIRVDKTLIIVYILTALTAAISGILLVSQTLVAYGRSGVDFPLDVITASVLGGASLSGGKGNITGMVVAAIMLAMIKNGLNVLSVPFFYQNMTTGLILIFALLMNGLQEKFEMKNAIGIIR